MALEPMSNPSRDRICFYGSNHFLSNMFEISFVDDSGITYNCVEQYFQAAKAAFFKDDNIYSKIMKAVNPKKQKSLGKQVRPFDKNLWRKESYAIVKKGVSYKFTMSDTMNGMCGKLLATGTSELVEASPFDRIWGVGLGRTKAQKHEGAWPGKNLLGKVLMEVRDDLSKEFPDVSGGCSLQDSTTDHGAATGKRITNAASETEKQKVRVEVEMSKRRKPASMPNSLDHEEHEAKRKHC